MAEIRWAGGSFGFGFSVSFHMRPRVFVVHGHDRATRDQVASALRSAGTEPIVLHEQPNRGMSILEKIEHNARVPFAVVILTPDDVGHLRTDSAGLKPRARQNVIFELGFFVGRIRRRRVCALYSRDVELPSDYGGICYIEIDPNGEWRSSLHRELRDAGVV